MKDERAKTAQYLQGQKAYEQARKNVEVAEKRKPVANVVPPEEAKRLADERRRA